MCESWPKMEASVGGSSPVPPPSQGQGGNEGKGGNGPADASGAAGRAPPEVEPNLKIPARVKCAARIAGLRNVQG